MKDEATAYYLEGGKQAHEAGTFLTDPEVATMLGVTPRTTLRWRRDGDGPPFVKIGPRRIRYRMSDVLAWLHFRTVSAGMTEATVSNPAQHEAPQQITS